jgi:hypothetical protein
MSVLLEVFFKEKQSFCAYLSTKNEVFYQKFCIGVAMQKPNRTSLTLNRSTGSINFKIDRTAFVFMGELQKFP